MTPTQANVDAFIRESKKKWGEMVEESGLSQEIFAVTSEEALVFISMYDKVSKIMVKKGFSMAPLFDGLEVTVNEP